jgi:hypothetical protein
MKRVGFLSAAVCLAIASGCGSDSDDDGGASNQSGGTIELGGECIHSGECKSVSGKEVECACSGQGPTKCVALLQPGESCSVGGLPGCRTGSRCMQTPGNPEATCLAYAKLGESCLENDCAKGSTCKDEVCAAAVKEGEPCVWSEQGPCVAGTFCDSVDAVCKPTVAIGAECSDDDECTNGQCYGSGGPHTCHAMAKAGEACESSFDCPDGYLCTGDVCTVQSSPTTCL